MPFCTYCGQSFTRDEHLERHILTHTNVKPYKCEICHMAFARRDLLSRHGAVHGKDSNDNPLTASGMAPKPAGRTPIACTNCAKTKTKCDKKFPCSRCEARKLTCTMRPTRRVSKSNARILEENNGLLPSLEDSASEIAVQSVETSSVSTFKAPRTPLKIHPAPPPSSSNSSVDLSSPTSQISPALASPINDSMGAFIHDKNYEYQEEFGNSGLMKDADPMMSSTQDMIDWSQMQMQWADPFSQDNGLLSPTLMPFNPNVMPYPEFDDSMNLGSNFAPSLAYTETPLSSPAMDGSFQFPNISSGMDYFGSSGHSRQTSSSTSATSPGTPGSLSSITADLEAITIAQDSWNGFKCTPAVPPSSCPKTARLNLERLEQSLRDHEGWSAWSPSWDDSDFALGDFLTVKPMKDFVRDKLLAVTQTFIQKAVELHKDDKSSSSNAGTQEGCASSFLILPPTRVLEYFLRSYANGFERFYPLSAQATLDVNSMMQHQNGKAASLLTLLMVAQGAMTTPSADARWLTGGLTETCRISLFDLVEKNILMAGDSTVLQAALLFVVQAAWSGDKWQMDIGRGQRGIYSAMLRHSGKLGHRNSLQFTADADVDTLWNEWVVLESESRLVYAWAMVDQDLSLFYDESPMFSVTEFNIPLPDSDSLWRATSSSEWSHTFSQQYENTGRTCPMSFRDLFQHFLDDDLLSLGIEITPLHLRLLLHPLQSLVCQFRQLLSCFSDQTGVQPNGHSFTATSTKARLQEVQAMLQRWYDLAEFYLKNNSMCPMMQATLVMFHLVSLNAVSNFPEIERLARREGYDGSINQMFWQQRKCFIDAEESVFHCGQVLRNIRSMPRAIRPPWWAAAVYRASLVLWANSLTHIEAMTHMSGSFPNLGNSFAVDALPADHPLIRRYLSERQGVPVLTKQDGSVIATDNPFGVLLHCMDVINEGVSTRFADGIKSKLGRLAKSTVQ